MTGQCLVIGSRGSQLALWQANWIAAQFQAMGIDTRIERIKTTGDRMQTALLPQAGGKGLFTKEIEEALLAGTIDVAVHSLKDLPVDCAAGLAIAAVPTREDPRDALAGIPFDVLPAGARVGTSSPRRRAQLLALRPDLNVLPVRGNVDTRLRKLHEGEYGALVLAAAGLKRLNLESEIVHLFPVEQMCCAPGQGALGIQTRESGPARGLAAQLNDDSTATAVACERAVLAGLGGGCQLPLGAYAEVSAGELQVHAMVASADGKRVLRETGRGPAAEFAALGRHLSERLLARGARQILDYALAL